MTVIIGIPCEFTEAEKLHRCVVLAADSEQSSWAMKSSVKKIAVISGEGWKCLIGGAGDGDFIDLAVQEAEAALGKIESPSVEQIAHEIERVVTQIHVERIGTFPPEERGARAFDLLTAISAKGGVRLVKIAQAHSVFQSNPRTIGTGGPLADYLTGTFIPPTMLQTQATRLAVYILHQVKKYAPYCGGESQVLFLDDRGTVGELWPATISALELNGGSVMEQGTKWLLYWTDPRLWGGDAGRVIKEGIPRAAQAIAAVATEAYSLPPEKPSVPPGNPTASTEPAPPSEPKPDAEQK